VKKDSRGCMKVNVMADFKDASQKTCQKVFNAKNDDDNKVGTANDM